MPFIVSAYLLIICFLFSNYVLCNSCEVWTLNLARLWDIGTAGGLFESRKAVFVVPIL